MDQQMDELNQKIDTLTAQITYLTEQARMAELAHQSKEELYEIALPIARSAMDLAAIELVEVQNYLDPKDLVRMLKKIIRHLPQLEILVDQIDAVTDLVDVVTPVTKEVVDKVSSLAEDLEQKGYFAFARGGSRMIENVVTHFSEEDVNRLGDNIVLILNTVKDMTQPEILTFVRNTLVVAEAEVQKPVSTSMFSLLKQMQDPAVRRGLALTMRVLHVIGEQAAPVNQSAPA